jgi:glycine/D-amino acid oxidase-like deaminating enzyme
VTLSWGTAHLALEEVTKSGRKGPAAVLGCGAVGLATARLLQSRGFEVTIYAKELPPETTSNVAGASWYPSLIVDEALRTPDFDAQFEKAARFSHRYFQGLVGERYGVHWREQYNLSDAPIGEPWEFALLRDLFPEPRALPPSEHPFASPYVVVDNMMFIEPPVYLATLLEDFRLGDGRLRVRAFATPAEVGALEESIVVNCTGLGARELFGDRDLVAVKGQLSVLLPQPEVDYAVATNDLYMFPRRDGILLGGTRERSVETHEANLAAEGRILQGHKLIFDEMR